MDRTPEQRKRSVRISLVAIGATLVLVLAVAAICAIVADGEASASAGSANGFPTNAGGQTYGSDFYADSPEQEPDLVLVQADNGKTGYCYSADLEEPMPLSA